MKEFDALNGLDRYDATEFSSAKRVYCDGKESYNVGKIFMSLNHDEKRKLIENCRFRIGDRIVTDVVIKDYNPILQKLDFRNIGNAEIIDIVNEDDTIKLRIRYKARTSKDREWLYYSDIKQERAIIVKKA